MKQLDVLDWIVLDRDIPTPLHYQLQQCIKSAIEDGRLNAGDRLPSIKEFAQACELSPTTVAQAFSQLAREGALVSRRSSGTVVATARPSATEVVIQAPFTKLPKEKEAFFYQIIDGLMTVYADSKRRITFSHYGTQMPTARELIDVCRARGAEEMVVYRPHEDFAKAIRVVAKSIPTVTLFIKVERSAADCIYADPAPPLRKLLREYISPGGGKFVYVGAGHLIGEDKFSPYYLMLEEFRESLMAAGIEPDIRIIRHADFDRERQESLRIAASLPQDSVILAATPDIAEIAHQAGNNSKFITYTECAASLNRYKAVADILYMGLEKLSAKAADLLKTRRDAGMIPQRIVSIRPAVYQG